MDGMEWNGGIAMALEDICKGERPAMCAPLARRLPWLGPGDTIVQTKDLLIDFTMPDDECSSVCPYLHIFDIYRLLCPGVSFHQSHLFEHISYQ